MEEDKLSTEQIINEYKQDVYKLIKYIPWLESKNGNDVSGIYEGEGIAQNSIVVPVYDSTLLNFVKDARETNLMDYNYAYVYSRYRIRSFKDEWQVIDRAKVTEIYVLKGILSKYVLKGMTKGAVWTEAIEHQIFLRVLKKFKELIEFWNGPLA